MTVSSIADSLSRLAVATSGAYLQTKSLSNLLVDQD